MSELQSFTWYSKVLILNQNIFFLYFKRMFLFQISSHEHNGLGAIQTVLKSGVNKQKERLEDSHQCRQNNPTHRVHEINHL